MRRRFMNVQHTGPVFLDFDTSTSDPANITLSGNMKARENLLSSFHRCLVKKISDNNVTIAYLDDQNSNYYKDGTPAKLDGSQGDVMVYFPEFYYKGIDTDTGYRFCFSLEYIDSTWKHAKESLVGAYKGRINSNMLYSISGVAATVDKSIDTFSQCAKSRGAGYHIIDYQQHCIIAWMFYLKYLTRDSQSICGVGGKSTGTGTSNTLCMIDTTDSNATSDSDMHVNFLGIEACWGYRSEFMEGIRTYSFNYVSVYDKGDYNATSSSMLGPERQYNIGVDQSGFIKDIMAGEYMDMYMSSLNGGSNSTYFCDYGSIDQSQNSVFIRSHNNSGNLKYGGVSYLYGRYLSSYTNQYISSRLAFDGNISIENNVTNFKKITAI